VSSSIIDLPVDSLAISQDFWWMLAIAALVFPMMLHRRLVHRWKGVVLVGIYCAYIALVVSNV